MNAPAAPYNIDVEHALLGAIFINNEVYHRINGFFKAEYFYEHLHREIYEAIEKFAGAGKAATPVNTVSYIRTQNVEDMTMSEYLARLAANATTVLNGVDFAHQTKELADRRRLIDLASDMAAKATDTASGDKVLDLIEFGEKELFEIAKSETGQKGFQDFNASLQSAIAAISAAYQRDGGLSGAATGLSDLDALMGGLQRSDLIVLAGRPAMGKTSLATQYRLSGREPVQASYRKRHRKGG